MHSNFYMIGIDSCCSWAQKLFNICNGFQNKGEVLYRNLPRVWHNLSFLVHKRRPEVEKNIWQVDDVWQVKIWQIEKDIWHGLLWTTMISRFVLDLYQDYNLWHPMLTWDLLRLSWNCFPGVVIFFQKTTQKFMYFLINLRTFCVISCTFGINIGTYCENMCTNVKTKSEMWKTIAFHWLNPIYALLSQNGKCREINLRNFLPQQLRS